MKSAGHTCSRDSQSRQSRWHVQASTLLSSLKSSSYLVRLAAVTKAPYYLVDSNVRGKEDLLWTVI